MSRMQVQNSQIEPDLPGRVFLERVAQVTAILGVVGMLVLVGGSMSMGSPLFRSVLFGTDDPLLIDMILSPNIFPEFLLMMAYVWGSMALVMLPGLAAAVIALRRGVVSKKRASPLIALNGGLLLFFSLSTAVELLGYWVSPVMFRNY